MSKAVRIALKKEFRIAQLTDVLQYLLQQSLTWVHKFWYQYIGPVLQSDWCHRHSGGKTKSGI